MTLLRSLGPCSALLLALASACDKPSASTANGESTAQVVDMPAASALAGVARSSNAFGAALYARLRERPGNLALSPISITTALAMTWGGARGETQREIGAVLQLAGDADAAALGKLTQALASPGRPLQLTVANRLFGERSFTFEQPFLDRTRATFGAPLEPLDFKGAPDPARRRINTWVDERTGHRIRDLLPPPAITSDTRMVLVNAIHFLADWQSPFKKEFTAPGAFKLAGGAEKRVPMMLQGAQLRLLAADGAQILELPYKDDAAAMLIALPEAADGLPALEGALSGAKLDEWQTALAAAAPQLVEVTLPSFTIEASQPTALSEALSALGMPLAFDVERADFTGIGVPPDPAFRLYVSEVFHKAFVKVDEKGTEAAAATAVVMAEGTGMPPKPTFFRADHPFLFFIVDKPSRVVLFMGRVVDPS